MSGLLTGRVSGEQAAALLMAIVLRGLGRAETTCLTEAMMRSGECLRWTDVDGPVLDKHSTGGIGDNVSLALAPAVAACGGFVPMISGRGLGHTGGTLDKLESIPGYTIQLSNERFRSVVKAVGCAIIGQTADLAPADKRLYAIRDVTGTVESVPLITASILSKKLAAGLGALVMDVKTGSGAFMQDLGAARDLARSMVSVATSAGLPTCALITDMDEPLANAAGNAVEVRHAVDHLTGRVHDKRLQIAIVALGAEMLRLGGLAMDADSGARLIEQVLSSGAAAERFGRMVTALGGPADFMDRPEHYLPTAPVCRPIFAQDQGVVAGIDARQIGLAVLSLGGGRTRSTDAIDARVGFTGLAAVGARADRDEPIGFVHAATEDAADEAAAALRQCYTIGEHAPAKRPLVIERIDETAA